MLPYTWGDGIPENYVEAVRWYRMAAEQGHAKAQGALGGMYSGGWGVPKDNVQAYAWVSIAAAQGDENAKELKGSISKSMTNAQFSAAQRLAREYWDAYVLPFRN